jgi:hypothetical protein
VDRCANCKHIIRRWRERSSGEWKISSYGCAILKCNILASGICNEYERNEE